jgi:hypothetical protein
MKVIVKFYEESALTIEEVYARVKEGLGVTPSSIEIYPDSNDPLDYIYFGIQQLITNDQLDCLFDAGPLYPKKLSALRASATQQLENELDRVISDNESKVSSG